jgi:hypothetical protein
MEETEVRAHLIYVCNVQAHPLPVTCADVCGGECGGPTEFPECPAIVMGLDFGQCDAARGMEGVSLELGCDDPLPFPDEFETFACCCPYLD